MIEQRGPHRSEILGGRPPVSQVAAAYLTHVLECDRTGAVRLLVAQVERGADPSALLHGVVEAAERELSRRRDEDALTAAQDSAGTAAATLARALLQPPVFTDLPG